MASGNGITRTLLSDCWVHFGDEILFKCWCSSNAGDPERSHNERHGSLTKAQVNDTQRVIKLNCSIASFQSDQHSFGVNFIDVCLGILVSIWHFCASDHYSEWSISMEDFPTEICDTIWVAALWQVSEGHWEISSAKFKVPTDAFID